MSALQLSLGLVSACLAYAAPTSLVDFSSNCNSLQQAWDFAKPMALSYVQTGKEPTFIPSYWAGLLDRPAFYGRDVAHHTLGAHVLGLDLENLSMLRVFAASGTLSRGYYPLWSFYFNGSTYPLDYQSDTYFVREAPTPFDLLAASRRLVAWTANETYATDEGLWTAWTNIVGPFVAMHDPLAQGVAGQANPTGNIFNGAASYNEDGEKLILAGDAYGKQLLAFEAYADMQELRGNVSGANATRAAAAALQGRFSSTWYNADKGFARGFNAADGFLWGFADTNSIFPASSFMLGPGAAPAAQTQIDVIVSAAVSSGTEVRTYMPEVLFEYGRAASAAAFIGGLLADPRNTYPEVSFTLVADLAVFLFGLQDPQWPAPGAAPRVTTMGGLLPPCAAAPSAQVSHLPVGPFLLTLAHNSSTAAPQALSFSLRVESGPAGSVQWEARMAGSFATLLVNGLATPATGGVSRGGVAYSSVLTAVPVGGATTVATP